MKKLQLSLCIVGAYLVLTAAYSGLNPGTAAAQQSGRPEVTVVNSPSQPVPVTGQVTVGSLPPVNLDTSTPLSIRDVDAPARQPFQTFISLGAPGQFTVPAGKRLVIENLTGNAYSTGTVFWISVQTTAAGQYSPHLFPVTFAGVAPSGVNVFVMAAKTTLYADPGSTVFITLDGLGPSGADRFVSISGHLVNVP